MQPDLIAAIYLIGTAMAAIGVGMTDAPVDDDWAGGWMTASLWPLILVVILAAVVIGGPFWLGRQIRKLWE